MLKILFFFFAVDESSQWQAIVRFTGRYQLKIENKIIIKTRRRKLLKPICEGGEKAKEHASSFVRVVVVTRQLKTLTPDLLRGTDC